MKAGIISFTKTGYQFAEKLAGILQKEGYEAAVAVKCAGLPESAGCSVAEWAEKQFQESDALIFVGAVGIAVRLIAPHLHSKLTDPAVIVFDERGMYGIPILSGHIGGANELALLLCRETGARPVITTATDIQEKWAADVFAVKNGFYIENMSKVKKISAKVLRGEKIVMHVEDSAEYITGNPPECLRVSRTSGKQAQPEPDIKVGIFRYSGETPVLCLVPRTVCIGIGCRKGTEEKTIEEAVNLVLEREGIWAESIEKAASIDLKAKEEGLVSYCRNRGLELVTFSAGELMEAEGEFSSSEFVEKTVGVDNVCERSAVKASGGLLFVKKQVYQGVTVALAMQKWSVHFE